MNFKPVFLGLAVFLATSCPALPVLRENVPGVYLEQRHVGKRHEPGTVFEYQVNILPAAQRTSAPLALYVMIEHRADNMGKLFDKLMEEDVIPPGILIHFCSGNLPATLPGGVDRQLRTEEFDQYGRDFSDFLIEEIIPEAVAAAKVKLDPSPDMHFISGGSSGALAAWNAVWFRNDYFRRAVLCSPTFSAMRGGEEAMVLLRKTESRPIRCYITCGSEEPDYFFGSSLYAAQNAASALEFAGYDFRFEQFDGEGHCCRREEVTLWRRMMAFIWANWRTQPVRTLGNQIRIRKLLAADSMWETFDGEMPGKAPLATESGAYTFDDHNIYLESAGKKRIVASGFGKISSLRISPDRWKLVIADETRRFLFELSIKSDGTLQDLYKLAPLHLAHDCRVIGARDIDVLADGRVLAATELGIQGVVTFGLTDLILPLPGDLPVEKVVVKGNDLYAASNGKVFRRKLRVGELDLSRTPKAPCTPGYSDGFGYPRSHLIK